jgi:hypothetical protein
MVESGNVARIRSFPCRILNLTQKRLAHLFDSFLHCPIMCSISRQRVKEDKGDLPICSTAFTFSYLRLVDLLGNE